MAIFDFFKTVNSISPDEVRNVIRDKSIDQYTLLDVRQPAEYAGGHLPGAILIPLGELRGRLKELDQGKQTFVYCRVGNRSRAAVGLLTGAGFSNTYDMTGGIMAYNGFIASGEPESGMFCFSTASAPGELAAVAWLIEDGTIRFLEGLKNIISDKSLLDFIDKLCFAKAENKSAVLSLYEEMTSQKPAHDFPHGVLETAPDDIMAGCVKVSLALGWAQGKSVQQVLESMMALEANTLDLYLKMGRITQADDARKVFNILADRENRHLEVVASLFDKTFQPN